MKLKTRIERTERMPAQQMASRPYKPIVVLCTEYDPESNTVKVKRIHDEDLEVEGTTYPLVYRTDVAESMFIRPGDTLRLIFTSRNVKSAYAELVTPSQKIESALLYSPVGGRWAIG